MYPEYILTMLMPKFGGSIKILLDNGTEFLKLIVHHHSRAMGCGT